jgi:predicted short-subunit dehydrogenase-like oxidoreductase (DUF2520 family)
VTFAIEGERRAVSAARLIAGSLGGNPIQITPERKAAYHAFGAFGSPLLIALLAAAEQVARSAGLSPNSARRAIAPLVKQTVENYIAKGGASAFTGPLVRGDVDTVRKHLKALGTDSAAKDAYLALANAAMKYLPVTNAEQIASVLNKRQH